MAFIFFTFYGKKPLFMFIFVHLYLYETLRKSNNDKSKYPGIHDVQSIYM